MTIDVIVECDAWETAGIEALAGRAFQAVAARFDWADGAYEAALLACDDARIAVLNADFRGKPTPTNVLSWPSEERDMPETMPAGEELGDMAIAFETCTAEAVAQNKLFEAHVSHLIVHGLLHLLGFDHETEQEAAIMEQIEVEILAKMGISDPYKEAGN